MKTIATIIFAFISVFVTAQTKLDTLVFNKVNEYRVSKGVPELKWDTNSFKAANLHTKYLVRTGRVGHGEDTLTNPEDRLKVFDKTHKWTTICEVALSTKPINISDTVSVDTILEKLANAVVEGWKSSKDHNDILLDKDLPTKFTGVSCIIKTKSSGFKRVQNYSVVSTMVLVGGIYRKL